MREHTKLPIILKGITTVEDALLAVKKGVDGIYLSNHGGRQIDHSPSPIEIAYEIRRNAPEIFDKVDVLADSGVRYGSDVLKLLALGVRAVGLGRPFMFANTYGVEGVIKAIQILKNEIAADAAQIGIQNVQDIPASFVSLSGSPRSLAHDRQGYSRIQSYTIEANLVIAKHQIFGERCVPLGIGVCWNTEWIGRPKPSRYLDINKGALRTLCYIPIDCVLREITN